MHLLAGMGGRDEMFDADLNPSDRASERPGRPDRKDFFRIKLALHPEATADVGRDDAQIALRHAEHASEETPNEMRKLRGAVEDDPSVLPGRIGKDTTRLHRRGDIPVYAIGVLDDPVRRAESGRRIADALLAGMNDVGA